LASIRSTKKKEKELADFDIKYKQTQTQSSLAREKYNLKLTTALDKLQNLECARVDILKGALVSCAEITKQINASLHQKSLMTLRTVRNVSKERDLKDFAASTESGKPCPWIEGSDNVNNFASEKGFLSNNSILVEKRMDNKEFNIDYQTLSDPPAMSSDHDTLMPLKPVSFQFQTMMKTRKPGKFKTLRKKRWFNYKSWNR